MTDKNLEKYKTLVSFLSTVLGKNYEIVLHWLDKKELHIAMIENSHISGRSVDSPLTAFALEMISNKTYQEKDFVTGYKASTKNGTEIQGSTFFIKNEKGALLGLLCINFDPSPYKDLAGKVLELGNISFSRTELFKDRSKSPELPAAGEHEPREMLSENIKDIILSVIDPELLSNKFALNQETKIEVVDQLDKLGIFQLKGAVSQVAEVLHISDPSIYRYLKIIHKKKEK